MLISNGRRPNSPEINRRGGGGAGRLLETLEYRENDSHMVVVIIVKKHTDINLTCRYIKLPSIAATSISYLLAEAT